MADLIDISFALFCVCTLIGIFFENYFDVRKDRGFRVLLLVGVMAYLIIRFSTE